ncbi:MAG: SPFH domain-containing protein [Clostridia bacterium]|nr:SPFH domain-containing protein [Clostridia bacterium]
MAQIADVIKYEGDNSTFIWKHPCEDFNSLTQLIVHESQEAIFFMNGQALDLFGPGRYTLETQNIPKIGKLLNRSTGGDTPFHCEVYFINKTVQMAIKWGTDSKVRFIEPTYGVPLELGASGEMNLMVSDPRKLLIKIVGTMNGIAWDDRTSGGFTKSLSSSFRPLISTAVKTNLSACIKANNINILEIDESLSLLSDVLKQQIIPGFEEYGLTIPEFYVTTVVLPESDPSFKRIRELHTISLQQKMIAAEAAIKTAQAESAAVVTAAERQAVLERETTATEIARREAERDIIRAQAEAQATKLSGFAEAEVMRAKGYTEKDVIQAGVQAAYAEGIGNMTITGGGGGVAGDMIGLGVGMAAAGAVSGPMSEMFKGMGAGFATESQPAAKITCPNCNSEVPENSKFCLECGTKIEILGENEMLCPACGKKTAKGKFCMECGASLVAKCPKCGAELPNGAKFCLECGEKLQ